MSRDHHPEAATARRDNDAPPRPARRQPPAAARPAPSWVLGSGDADLTREELLARYRRQRALPDDPFENGGRPTPPPGYRDRIMNQSHGVRFMERAEAVVEAPRARRRSFTLGETFAIAAAMSLVAGAAAGVGSAWMPRLDAASAPSALSPAPAVEAAPPEKPAPRQLVQAAVAPAKPAVPQQAVDRKPIATATLQVADVTGASNSLIPLALHAEPAGTGSEMLLRISGIPDDAYLTSGHREPNKVWALSLAESKGVKLVVPQARQPQIDLSVAAFEPHTGELAAPVKTMTVALKDAVVEPASAPPPGRIDVVPPASKPATPSTTNTTGPVAIPPPQSTQLVLAVPETAATRQLIVRAGEQFGSGDVAGARRSYEQAWGNDGSAAAAFGLARSYDPLVLAALTASNATPDKAQAIHWYQRAALGGNADATEAIVRLQLKP